MQYAELHGREICKTIERLRERIVARFPGSGLSRVAEDLSRLANAAEQEIERLRKPLWLARIGAALLTEITGRRCSYYQETMEEAKQSRAKYGAPDSTVAAWISTYTAIANDELSTITDDIRHVTGHAPHTLRDFLLRHPESYQHIKQGK